MNEKDEGLGVDEAQFDARLTELGLDIPASERAGVLAGARRLKEAVRLLQDFENSRQLVPGEVDE